MVGGGVVAGAGEFLPLVYKTAIWLADPANQQAVATVGGLGIGLIDPTGQVD
jgi:hypothetical protein